VIIWKTSLVKYYPDKTGAENIVIYCQENNGGKIMDRKSAMYNFNHLIISGFSILIIMLPVIIQAQPLYQITKVKSWDTLNIRSAPSVKSSVIAQIPANGNSILLAGNRVTVGNTVWVKINWQGKQGWVNKYFLQPMQTTLQQAPQSAPAIQQQTKTKVITHKQQTVAPVQNTAKPASNFVDKGVGRNQWILRCGNTSPFWRVDVYPKALKLFTGKYNSLLPITYKKQDKNKWNTAKKTHLKGATSNDNIDLTIRYSYSRCNDTINKKKVPYTATIIHNSREMKGCCMALKIN
jgi:uncharacterized membrane protein